MRSMTRSLLAVALLAGLPLAANAESKFVNGAGNASANLDFQITIPRILFLRVGTGTDLADNTGVDKIAFTVPAANVADGTAIAGTGGDLAGGAVTAKVVGNNGTITLNATSLGALNNGVAGDTISYSQITTTATVLTSATALPAPVLADGASANVTVAPISGKSVVRDAKWTFKYTNSVAAGAPAPGVYGGVNTQNSRVTYTASMP